MKETKFDNLNKVALSGQNVYDPQYAPEHKSIEGMKGNQILFLFQENKRVIKNHISSLANTDLTASESAKINMRIDELSDENKMLQENHAEDFI